jgi:hypothetical protein
VPLTSNGQAALRNLFSELADLYAAEGRPGGDAAATALRQTAHEIPANVAKRPTHYDAVLRATLALNPQPIATAIRDAIPFIHWGGSDMREDRIPEAMANQMPMCELVGPDGMFPNTNIRVGLWMQQANLKYGPRRHAAEETFLILAGSALWSMADEPPSKHGPGAARHHPSNILHTSITTTEPVFAAWRWSGDIGFDQYQLKS